MDGLQKGNGALKTDCWQSKGRIETLKQEKARMAVFTAFNATVDLVTQHSDDFKGRFQVIETILRANKKKCSQTPRGIAETIFSLLARS